MRARKPLRPAGQSPRNQKYVRDESIAATAFLYNETRQRSLAQDGRVLRGWRTGIGAMVRGLPGSLVLVWWRPAKISITNWFVPQDLDIIWVDSSWRVVDFHERFASWAWRTVNTTPAQYVVELPAGTIAASGTRRGDRIVCRAVTSTNQ